MRLSYSRFGQMSTHRLFQIGADHVDQFASAFVSFVLRQVAVRDMHQDMILDHFRHQP